MNDYSNHIVIVGAGIAGLALGNILKMHNIPCVIFEKNENISEYGAGISISPNGLKVLEYLEVLESFNEISRQPIEATFFSNEKKLIKIPVNVSTGTRKNLYKVLFNKYLSMGGNVIFDHEVSSISLNKKEIYFTNNKKYDFLHIAACDGIKSICQRTSSQSFINPQHSGYYVWRTIFPSEQQDICFYLSPNQHIVTYPIDKQRLSFVAAIKSKNKENESWKQEGLLDDLLSELPASIVDKYPTINNNDGIYKWGIYLRPNLKKFSDKNVTFLGDAAHPIVPFMGQGACLALEDAFIFGHLINKYRNDFKKSQKKYNFLRVNRVNSIYIKSLNQAKLNHLSNPFLILLRNLLMKYTNIISNRTKDIWSYDVNAIIHKLDKNNGEN